MANHFPNFGRKVPGSCADPLGSADPFAHIDCPKCRERIAAQVASKRDGAMSFDADSQERPFFLKNADALEAVLAA